MMKSPIRFVGGKSWLVKVLVAEIEAANPPLYIEPFLGGGAIALNMPRHIAMVLSDSNSILMDMWHCLRVAPDTLIHELARCTSKYGNEQEGYLRARVQLNSVLPSSRLGWIQRSALFLYINARCF